MGSEGDRGMGGGTGGEQVILATAGYDHTIRFWQAHSGICRRTVVYSDSQVNVMEITPDKQLLAAAGYQHLRMYELHCINPNPVLNYEGINKNITALGFHEDGKWMYTGGEDGSARIWDLRSRNMQCQRIFQANAPVNCVCIHSNQAELIVGDQTGIMHIWDLRTNKNEQLIPEPDSSIQHVSINTEGTLAAAVTNTGNCYVWNISQGIGDEPIQLTPKLKIGAHTKYALKCKFSPDSKYLATTSADATVKIWNTTTFGPMKELTDINQRWVWDIAFSADSQYIITASSDNMARLWNVEQAEVKREYSGHQKAVTCLAFRDVAVTC